MSNPNACTIVSNNYLPFARAFARSFRRHHPEGRVHVLIVDTPHADLDYDAEPFEVTFASEVDGLPAFDNFCFRYSILELNTAVKPYFLEHLIEHHGLDRLCYFDPDILITSPLDALYDAMSEADVVLTPHVLEPIEDDGKTPTERDFLLSGIYNLGFVGVSARPPARRLVSWWQRRLRHLCLHRIEEGLFVDQRWFDFAPAFVDEALILRDPGYNVAYWNLSQRRLTGSLGDGFEVHAATSDTPRPLRFFHFSGFDLRAPGKLSKYQDRIELSDRSDLTELFELYSRRLREEGFETLRTLPYGFGRFRDGVAVPDTARRLLGRHDPDGTRWPDPFATGQGSYQDWIRGSELGPSEIPLSRLALSLWEERPDLQQAFPEPKGRDLESYSRWFVDGGAQEAGIDAALTEPLAGHLTRAAQARSTAPESRPARSESAPEPPPAEERSRLLGRLLIPHQAETAFGELSAEQNRWLAESTPGGAEGPVITRLAEQIHRRRPDLQRRYAQPLSIHRPLYALWFTTYGRLEYSLPGEQVEPVLRSLAFKDKLWAQLWWLKHGRRARTAQASKT